MSKKRFFLESTLDPKLRFEILERDPITGVTKIQGIGASFEEILTKERIAELGYKVAVQEDGK
jgi:hypothetical protein